MYGWIIVIFVLIAEGIGFYYTNKLVMNNKISGLSCELLNIAIYIGGACLFIALNYFVLFMVN